MFLIDNLKTRGKTGKNRLRSAVVAAPGHIYFADSMDEGMRR